MPTRVYNPETTWQVPLPSEQRQQQMGQLSDQLMPAIYGLLSGEKVDGITPRLAQQLMGVLTPDRVANIYQRRPEGAVIDPNWYQNYLPQGTVNQDLYNNIMGYSQGLSQSLAGIGTDDAMALSRQAIQPWVEPMYQIGGHAPTFQQSLVQNAYDNMRMGMSGMEYDPWEGQWRLGNEAQLAGLGQSLTQFDNPEGLGLNVDEDGNWTVQDESLWKRFLTDFVAPSWDNAYNQTVPGQLQSAIKASEQNAYDEAIMELFKDQTPEQIEELMQILQSISNSMAGNASG